MTRNPCHTNLFSILFTSLLILHYNLLLQLLILVQSPENVSSVLVWTRTQNCISNRVYISSSTILSPFLCNNHKVYGKNFNVYDSDEGKYYKKSKYSKVGFKHKEKKQTSELNKFKIFTPFEKEKLFNLGEFDCISKNPITSNTNFAKFCINLTKETESAQDVAYKGESLDKPNMQNGECCKDLLPSDKEPDYSTKKVDRDAERLYIDKSIIYDISSEQYIVIGFITSTHGLNGWVRVKSYTNNPELKLCKPGYRFLKFPYNDDTVVPMKIIYGKCMGEKDTYLIKLEGMDSKTQALRLKGAYITLPLNEMDPLEENTFYSRDLLNLDLYLYNDTNKTKLGKIVGFLHRSDLAYSKKYEDIIDDLIDVEMDMRISLKTLINVAKESSTNADDMDVRRKGVSIITETDINDADEIVDIDDELDNHTIRGVRYIKYYTCSICKKSFTNYDRALKHDKIHQHTQPIQDIDDEKDEGEKIKLVDLEEISKGKIKRPIRRFYVPLLRNETVKFIDLENKSVYVDPYTIFIGEDGTDFKKNEN